MNDTPRVRTNRTNKMKDPVGVDGYVFSLDNDRAVELINNLSASLEAGTGVALFINVFENESQFEGGNPTYLSTTIGVSPDRPLDNAGSGKFVSNSDKKASQRANTAKSINKAFSNKSGGGASRRGGGLN